LSNSWQLQRPERGGCCPVSPPIIGIRKHL
jgi:hypothetical protein